MRRSRYSIFRRSLLIALTLIIALGGIGLFIYSGVHGTKANQPISAIQNTLITDNKETFIGPYFQFQDTGKWVLDKNSSNANEFIYLKYRGRVLEHQLKIYVNKVPIPLYLAVSRVLPVRIVNSNSFQVSGVSDSCSNQYALGEPRRVKEISIAGASMMCDPDTAQYSVVISEIGGDYRLHLVQPNGAQIQFVITYFDLGLSPTPDSVLNIANSFQTR